MSFNLLSDNKLEKNIITNKEDDNDENFLKKILKDFYNKIIETNDFNNFEEISIEWIKNNLKINDNKNPKKILELMKNHEESKILFTSFIGFFYQLGIGCDI